MSTPSENDPTLARFRRGAAPRATPPGPPPRSTTGNPTGGDATPTSPAADSPGAGDEAPLTLANVPGHAAASAPAVPAPPVPPRPLFGDLLREPGTPAAPAGGSLFAPAEPDGGWGSGEWRSEDGSPTSDDPGKTLGIVAILVGVVLGIAGVFIAIASVRSSRRAGLSGVYGFVAILVSVANIVVALSIGLTWLRYETSLAQQCSLVGPGQFLTQSGDQVTCR